MQSISPVSVGNETVKPIFTTYNGTTNVRLFIVDLYVSMSVVQVAAVPLIPYCCNLDSSNEWSIVSDAFFKNQ